jgi:hypothetical protein
LFATPLVLWALTTTPSATVVEAVLEPACWLADAVVETAASWSLADPAVGSGADADSLAGAVSVPAVVEVSGAFDELALVLDEPEPVSSAAATL